MAEAFIPQILSLLTPRYLLEQTDFPAPELIHPENYPNFDALLEERERIRTLQLLPVRTPEDRKHYQSQPQEQMRSTVESYLEGTDFALQRNPFPYHLPSDVGEHIVWIKDKEASPEAISEFLAPSLTKIKHTPDSIILFEKSHLTQTKIVRGTYPHRRHIHLLLKKE
jgi:hypothetical protein